MSTQRTINGKPMSEVVSEIKKPFPFLIKDMAGNYALDEEQVYERLDAVCGLNWSFILTMQPKLESISSDKHTVTCAGFIEVRDDAGLLVSRRSQAGGSDVIKLSKDPKPPKDLSNDYKIAVTDCFKKCAKSYGIRPALVPGGKVYNKAEEYYDEQTKAGQTASSTSSGKSNASANTNGKGNTGSSGQKSSSDPNKENSTAADNGAQGEQGNEAGKVFKVVKEAVRDNKKVKFEILDETGGGGELVFWNNVQKKLEPEVLQKINNLKPGAVLTVTCKSGEPFQDKRQFFVETVLKVA